MKYSFAFISVFLLVNLYTLNSSFSQTTEIVHLVLFKYKEGIDKNGIMVTDAIKMVEKLPEKIKEIKKYSSGTNFSERSIAYDFGLYVTFDSKDDLKKYLSHPAHIELANAWKTFSDWHIVDYETRK